MTKRDIIKAILAGKAHGGQVELPERIGVCEDFWPETINTTWPAQGFGADTDPTTHFDLDLADIQEYWRNWRTQPQAIVGGGEMIADDGETVVYRSGWGATTRVWKNKNGTPEHIAFDMTSREIWADKYRPHLLDLDVRRFPDLDLLRRRYRDYTEAGRFTMYNSTFVFENMRYSMGDFAMLEAFATDPDWLRDFCEVYTDFTITHVDYLFREVGAPDGYTIYDDMAYTTSSFVSPAMYRELITPYHRRFVDFLKSHGVAVILHSCGQVAGQLENVVAAGIDCVQPMEAKTGMDMIALAEAFRGRLAFMGNIDIRALETNDRQAVADEILPKLAAVRDNRIPYIFHTDHSVSPLVNVTTYEYALELFRDNCTY